MRLQQVVFAFGLAALAGCTSTSSTGVVAMGPDMYGMKVVSRNLGTAAEKGLTDATVFCNGMGRQTQLLRTQITNEDYQLVFRCMGSAPVVVPPPANPVPSIAGMAVPNPNAPVIAGPAFIPPRTVPGFNADRLAAQGRNPIFPAAPPVLANPAPPPPPPLPALGNTPVAPLLAGGRGSRPPSFTSQPNFTSQPALPPISGPTPLQPQFTPMAPLTSPAMPAAAPEPEAPRPGFFGRLFGAGDVPRQPALPPVPAAGASPGGMFPPPAVPAAPAPLPPVSSPLEPLRSPLAPISAPAGLPAAPPPASPLALPPVAEPPPRTLPPVPLQPLPRLSTNVPNTLPPPTVTGGAAPTLAQPVSTEPPNGFWQTPRS